MELAGQIAKGSGIVQADRGSTAVLNIGLNLTREEMRAMIRDEVMSGASQAQQAKIDDLRRDQHGSGADLQLRDPRRKLLDIFDNPTESQGLILASCAIRHCVPEVSYSNNRRPGAIAQELLHKGIPL